MFGRDPARPPVPPDARATRRALEGITRSIGKELRAGATANLVLVGDGAEANADAALRFLLSGRSAYVDGQVVRVGAAAGGPAEPDDWAQPRWPARSRSSPAPPAASAPSIADVLARDGATVVCVDIPAAGELARPHGQPGRRHRAPARRHRARRRAADRRPRHDAGTAALDIVVHNAGITRDKLLANMDEARWASVLDVNLGSILRMNEALLADGRRPADGGHVVLVSSIAGIAGNRGQTNYGASKAGVIGLVDALGRDPGLRAPAASPSTPWRRGSSRPR